MKVGRPLGDLAKEVLRLCEERPMQINEIAARLPEQSLKRVRGTVHNLCRTGYLINQREGIPGGHGRFGSYTAIF